MADAITPIDAKSVVTDISRPADTAKDVSSWFKQETLELNFGDTTGRPNEVITLQREYLSKFLETGWVIDAIVETGSGGSWVNTGGTVTTSKSGVLNNRLSGTSTLAGTDQELTNIGTPSGRSVQIVSTPVNQYYGTTAISGTDQPINVSIVKSTPSAEAPAYWTAYQKIRLKRRRIVAEEVMKSMLTSFTAAYNGGRELEDKRYNQVVSLYSLMLQRSESEGNALISGSMDITPLLTEIKERILKSMDSTEEISGKSTSAITEAAIADIEREFAAKIAAEKAREISIGLYVTTVWPTVEAGYLRQKAAAITKARAEAQQSEFSIKSNSSTTIATAAAQLANAAATISKQADERGLSVINLRNSVLKWMLDYVGGREESYPELEESATLAEQMGFSNSAAATSVM